MLWFRRLCVGVVVCVGVVCGGGVASADSGFGEVPVGCNFDLGVPNVVILNCEGGDGSLQHAFIRCIDFLGIIHTHIGETISTAGGFSVAACDPNWREVGPYDGPALFPTFRW